MLGLRLKQLRQARGLSLEELAAQLGGLVSRQALWKYEQDKARPSATILTKLADAFGTRAALLWQEPSVQVRFIAYRKGSGLLKRDQDRVQSMVTLALESRLRLKERTGQGNSLHLPIQSLAIHSIADAEGAAEELRRLWNLGSDPLASVTDILEDHDVHVLEIDADEKFDGISAVAEEAGGAVIGAAVVTRRGIAGERQRLDLAHELGHLVLQVPQDIDEEKAAFRFGAAFLAPQEGVRRDVGAKRAYVQLAELRLLKRRYAMSIQALLRRLKDLDIITDSHYRQWCIDINRLGYRKNEPERLPVEQPQWLRRTVLRALAEGLLDRAEAEEMLGEKVDIDQPLTLVERRALMKLPLSERRRILAAQSDRIATHYEEDTTWRDLHGGDIVDY